MGRKSTIAITLGALAAGAVIATGVTGVATAATNAHDNNGQASQGTTTTDGQRAGGGRGDGMRGPGGMHRPRGLLEAGTEPLHGETVVKKADGSIVTVRMVSGDVTAVSATSITVMAEDGFTATYAVTSDTEVRAGLPERGQKPDDATGTPPASTDTIADIAVGDVAHVVGTVAGSTATAVRVHATSPE